MEAPIYQTNFKKSKIHITIFYSNIFLLNCQVGFPFPLSSTINIVLPIFNGKKCPCNLDIIYGESANVHKVHNYTHSFSL